MFDYFLAGRNNSVGFIHRNNYFISTKEQTLFAFTHQMKTLIVWLSIFMESILWNRYSFSYCRFSDFLMKMLKKLHYSTIRCVGENPSPQKNKTPFIYVKCNTKEIIFLRSHSNMFQIKSSRGFPRELHRYSYLIYLIAVTKYKCSTLQ